MYDSGSRLQPPLHKRYVVRKGPGPQTDSRVSLSGSPLAEAAEDKSLQRQNGMRKRNVLASGGACAATGIQSFVMSWEFGV